jgi:hypothetical protein
MKHLVVHKDLLTKKSEVFDRMFNGGFKEATTKSATFPDDDPEAFEKLIEWLYTGRFMTISSNSGQSRVLFDMALLASKYSIWELLDRATTGYVKCMKLWNYLPAPHEIRAAYEKFPPESKMKLFMARCVAWLILKTPNDYSDSIWENKILQSIT